MEEMILFNKNKKKQQTNGEREQPMTNKRTKPEVVVLDFQNKQ